MTFLTNSGAEAVEAALKLARYVTGRKIILGFQGGFHGRTYGAITMTTSKVHYREGYEPFVPSTYFMPFPYGLRCQLGHDCKGGCVGACADFIERQFAQVVDPHEVAGHADRAGPGRGRLHRPAGLVPASACASSATSYGILLIADEVQTGFGRTGKWFASEHFDVVPDIQVMAKGIASGFPLAAISARRDLMEQWPTGAHGSTFGGNPVSCAAAIATIDAIREEGMLENATRQGERSARACARLQAEAPAIAEVRGLGLMNAIEFSRRGRRARRRGRRGGTRTLHRQRPAAALLRVRRSGAAPHSRPQRLGRRGRRGPEHRRRSGTASVVCVKFNHEGVRLDQSLRSIGVLDTKPS